MPGAVVEGVAAEDGFSEDDTEIEEMLRAETNGEEEPALSQDQKARADRNRLKAVALRKARLQAAPYSKEARKKDKKLVDGGGGFFLEEEEEEAEVGRVVVSQPPPLLPPDQPDCEECARRFADSHLLRTYDLAVCDDCKDMEKEGKHSLITKTEAKKEFLLRDGDFEKGERDEEFVPLKFILRKNPHNPRWGDMKLFLRMQVEERALQVWGSEEALEKEVEAREERQVVAKSKKYEKKMKELRKTVRSSLFTKSLGAHEHDWGEEAYHEATDEYSRTCVGCGHVNTYEKM